MNVTAVYSGFQPLASCHFQGMANILAAQGVRDAETCLGMSWGFSRRPGTAALAGANRWMALINRTHGLRIVRSAFTNWQEADRHERALAARGLPFVAEVDSFDLPSEYFHLNHVPHTVIVLSRNRSGTFVLDPMNGTPVTRYDPSMWQEMRSHPCVDSCHLYASPQPPSQHPESTAMLSAFRDDHARHWASDREVLANFLADMDASDLQVDVCRVGAERLQTSRFLDGRGGEIRSFADDFLSLSRRWYLVHTLAEQSDHRDTRQRARLLRLLRELSEREESVSGRIMRELERFGPSELADAS